VSIVKNMQQRRRRFVTPRKGCHKAGQPAGCSRYTAVTLNKPLDFERGQKFFARNNPLQRWYEWSVSAGVSDMEIVSEICLYGVGAQLSASGSTHSWVNYKSAP
jgi:hypothetical protein